MVIATNRMKKTKKLKEKLLKELNKAV